MTLVNIIRQITDWLNDNACKKIKLKLPDDAKNGNEYEYTEVFPTAFPLFMPTKEKLPPGVTAPFPSICVQLLEGNDARSRHTGTIKLQLSLTTWNPGTHAAELLENATTVAQQGDTDYSTGFTTHTGQGGAYTRNADGWADVWNFVDVVLADIENADYIAGLRVSDDIQFGQFQVEGAIADLYPYWGAWIILTLERSIARAEDTTKQYL